MLGNKMEQKAGNNSNNLQIVGDYNVIGVSATEARQIANDVFKANFYELTEQANTKASERAKQMINDFIQELCSQSSNQINKLQEPSMQYSLFDALKVYARTGDINLKEQLISLLIRRINSKERSLSQIVLDESIGIIPLLSAKQINSLSLKFIVGHTKNNINNIQEFNEYIEQYLLPFLDTQSVTEIDLRHIEYCKCGQSIIGTRFWIQIISNYSNIFQTTNKIDDLTDYNDIFLIDGKQQISLDEYVKKYYPNSINIMNMYDSSIYAINLTSVGIAIGLLNAEAKLKKKFDLSIWIN